MINQNPAWARKPQQAPRGRLIFPNDTPSHGAETLWDPPARHGALRRFSQPNVPPGGVLRGWNSSRESQAQQDISWSPKPLPPSLCPQSCHFQGRGQTPSSSTGTDCWVKGTFISYDMVGWLEANTALMVRHLHLKEFQHQQSKKEA